MVSFFKIIAFLEGISLLLLLFFAMPMKYLFQQPVFVKIIGMTHGGLFVSYVVIALFLGIQKKWNSKKISLICMASVVPFGTFYIDKKYFRNV